MARNQVDSEQQLFKNFPTFFASLHVPYWLFRFSSPEYRPARAFLFVSLGGFGLVPATHFIIQSGLTAAMVTFLHIFIL